LPAWAIGRVRQLGDDTFGAKGTGFRQQLSALTHNVLALAEIAGTFGVAQQSLQLLFTLKLRQVA
jgi:hypothetical protein